MVKAKPRSIAFRSLPLFAAALLVAASMPGCSSTRTQRSRAVGEQGPPVSEVLGDTAYPRIAGSKRFVHEQSGWGSSESIYTTVTYVPQSDGTWLTHAERSGERTRSSRLTRNARGIALLETTDFESQTRTVFGQGGLMLMPTRATPEGLYGNTVDVEIYDLDAPGRIKQRGTATRDIEYLADEPIQTPAGLFNAARMRSVLLMELSSANVNQTDALWIHSKYGVIAEDSSLQVRVFGVPIKTEATFSMLAELPSDWREPSAAIGQPLPEPMQEDTLPPPPAADPGAVMQPVR